MQESIDNMAEAIDDTFSDGCMFMFRVIEEQEHIVIHRQDLHLGQLAETPDMFITEEDAFARAYHLAEFTGKKVMRTYP